MQGIPPGDDGNSSLLTEKSCPGSLWISDPQSLLGDPSAAKLFWEVSAWDLLTMVTLCFASFSAASGEAVLYQTPAYIAVPLGESISITCRANQSISDYLSWHKQKPGQAPMILIYDADNRRNGVPERFTATQSGTDFVFTISQIEADDAAMYYCQQSYVFPPTLLQPRT